MRIVIVADDLTGALDAAAPFADAGLRASVVLDAASAAGRPGADAVLSIDTDTREAQPEAAALVVERAFASVTLAGALPFKKLDSTLRGNVGAELAAAMRATGRRIALVAPAAPKQGRTLRGGLLFVEGRQVGQRPLADMLREHLPGLPIRSLAAGEGFDLTGSQPCVLVADADAEEQLEAIAAFGLAHPGEVLLAGSSGLSSAMARLLTDNADTTRAPRRFDARRLYLLIGSHHARSAEQVQALLAAGEVPAFVLSPGMADGLPLDAARSPRAAVVHVEGLGAPPRLDPRWIAQRLGDAAHALLGAAAGESVALLLTGGATARSVLERLGVERIEIVASLFPGVVHGRVMVAGRAVDLITKSGGFGERDLLVRLVREFAAAGS
jgi:D-threonate/D-erythronate kinase